MGNLLDMRMSYVALFLVFLSPLAAGDADVSAVCGLRNGATSLHTICAESKGQGLINCDEVRARCGQVSSGDAKVIGDAHKQTGPLSTLESDDSSQVRDVGEADTKMFSFMKKISASL